MKKEQLHMKNGKPLAFKEYQKRVDKAWAQFIKTYNPFSKTKELGRFVVDSGECFIGDPNYKEAGIKFNGFGGDGGYAVYAEYNEYNEITSVRIDFTNSDKYPKIK